jgi:excisionase family DNA binding protein
MNGELTVRQAAEKLGVTPGRVRQLVTEGKLKPRYLTPRMMMLDAKQVARYKRPKMGRPVSKGKKVQK